MLNINYPIPPKWYIAFTGNRYSYGKIESNQCMTSGLENIETFTEEAPYLARLTQLGISQEDL